MPKIPDIKQFIQIVVPLAEFKLIEFPKRHSQELEVKISGNMLIIEVMADNSYGVTIIDSSEDVWESFFTPYPDTIFDSYEPMKEYIIEKLKNGGY